MEEVLDHNQEAEQIFRQYGRLLELVAAAQLPGRPEDAEECVQDAVWAFVEGRAPWDPAQGSKQTWLCVLVRSRAKDRRRALAARRNTLAWRRRITRRELRCGTDCAGCWRG